MGRRVNKNLAAVWTGQPVNLQQLKFAMWWMFYECWFLSCVPKSSQSNSRCASCLHGAMAASKPGLNSCAYKSENDENVSIMRVEGSSEDTRMAGISRLDPSELASSLSIHS